MIRSLAISAICIAAGVMLIAMTLPAALIPTGLVVGFAAGLYSLAHAFMELAMLHERITGTRARFAGFLKRKGVTE